MLKIFVTVGTHPKSFHRLIEKVDELAGNNEIDAEFFGQIGNSEHIPKNIKYKNLLDDKEFEEKIKWADIIISHGGAGSIINALKYRKALILFPRLKKFNEHTNDHQLDLCKKLEEKKKVIAAYSGDDLLKAIKKSENFKENEIREENKIGKKIEEFFNEEGLI